MYRRPHWLLATLGAGLLLVTGQAAATTITSTTYGAWTAGLTRVPTELDFSPIVVGRTYNTAAGIMLKAIGNSSIGFNVTGPDNASYK